MIWSRNKIDLPKLNTIDYKQQSRDLVKQSTLTNSIEEDSKALFNSKILYFMTSHRSCCRKAYSKWYDESTAQPKNRTGSGIFTIK